jgi:hypothetical protein
VKSTDIDEPTRNAAGLSHFTVHDPIASRACEVGKSQCSKSFASHDFYVKLSRSAAHIARALPMIAPDLVELISPVFLHAAAAKAVTSTTRSAMAE